MGHRIGQLILTPASKNSTISEVFVAEPDSEKEALAGKIFILLEIETKRSDGLKLSNFLINFINNSYYQNEKLILKEKIPSLRIEHIFESVISKANKKILEFIKEEKIKISTKSLNSTIGLIYNDEIHFSTAGKNRSLLIYKKAQSQNNSYKTIDLNNSSTEEDASRDKIFTNVISGTIPEGSTFVFSNEPLPEYLSPNQLSDIVTKLPPTSAVEQMKNTLAQINEYISFIGIIIKSSNLLSAEANTTPISNNNESSINKLNNTEQETEEILSPTGASKVKKYAKAPVELLSKMAKGSQKQDDLFTRTKSKINPRVFKFYSKKLLNATKSLLILILNSIFFLFKYLSDKEKLNATKNSTLQYSTSAFTKMKSIFSLMRGRYKYIIIIFIFSVFGIFYNINKSNQEKLAAEKLAQYNELKSSIEQKQNQAEANLLYNNDDGAKELFIEIRDLLDTLPQETEEQKTQYDDFYTKLNEQIDKVRKVVEIPLSESMVNFSSVNKNAKVSSIVLLDNNIYASDPDQDSIYIYDINSKLATTITDINKSFNNLSSPIVSDDGSIYWYNNESIIKLDSGSEEIFQVDLAKEDNSDIKDMKIFNNRPYMLDSNNSQIYRYETGDSGFAQYSTWLNEDIDLSKSVALSIDGNIFTLDTSGQINKFLKGDQENFIQDLVEPEVENANKLIVSQNEDLLYILEGQKSRIISFRKDGKFIEQYQSKNLNSIDDIILDEENKTFYILSNNSIYSFAF